MLKLEDLMEKIADTEDFKVHSRAFLRSRKQEIESHCANKDQKALARLLETEVQNLAYLHAKLQECGEHIANLNKIEQYIS